MVLCPYHERYRNKVGKKPKNVAGRDAERQFGRTSSRKDSIGAWGKIGDERRLRVDR